MQSTRGAIGRFRMALETSGRLTPGNLHEINSLTGLLDGSESMLFADSAYSSKKIRGWMAEKDIKDRVQRKGYPLAVRALHAREALSKTVT